MRTSRRIAWILAPALLAAGLAGLAQTAQREFTGTIKGTIPIRMKLSIDGGKVEGAYYYEKYKKDIRLRGTIDAQKAVLLEELDPSGNRTGVFTGRFTTGDTIEGTWSSPDGAKTMPFSVTAAQAQPKTLARGPDPTGTYQTANGTLEVLKLPGGRLKVRLIVVQGPGAHIGEVDSEIELRGDTAVYKNGACEITFRFSPEAAVVEQKGTDSECDFGAFVTVAGRYGKEDGPPPKFE